ncbi:MAG: MalY/PatB family protein [Treponema sp.]
MKYDFDEIIDHAANFSAKVEEAYLHYGTNEVIPLWIADMDFKTAQPIIDAIIDRAHQGIFGYTFRPDEYFNAIADWQNRRNNYSPDTALMAFAPGVVPAMRLLLQLFSTEQNRMMITTPVYHPFTNIVLNTNRTLVNVPLVTENGVYKMNFQAIEAEFKKGITFFIFCNPHNPVGRVWTKKELETLTSLCVKYKVKIISDEIHSDLIFSGYRHIPTASISKKVEKITYTLIAPSKTFNLAGLQAATIIFPNAEEKKQYVAHIKAMDIARNNCFSLVATIAAYRKGEEWLNQVIEYIHGNMEFISEYCKNNIPLLKPNRPEATYLCWIDARALQMNDDELKRFMVEKAGLALGSGRAFGEGGSGFVRLNAATSRQVIEKALMQLTAAINNLA